MKAQAILTVIKHYQDLKIFDTEVDNENQQRSHFSPPKVFGKIFHQETAKLAKKAASKGSSSFSQNAGGKQTPAVLFQPFPQ